MSNLFTERVLNKTAVTPQPEDYMGEDGLLYCGKCHTPKEAYFPEKQAALFGRDRHPAECDCQRAEREKREAAEKQRSHLETVERLKRRGFTDPAMQGWTFENLLRGSELIKQDFNLICLNRGLFVILSLILIALSVVVYNKKRGGKLNYDFFLQKHFGFFKDRFTAHIQK